MSEHIDSDSDYFGMKLNRDANGRVILAFGSVLAKQGDKVRFLGENGWDHERRKAKDCFDVGDELIVDRVRVGMTSSRYVFADVPGDWNTVMFERVALSTTDGTERSTTKGQDPHLLPAKEGE